jgi:hypothetical protein
MIQICYVITNKAWPEWCKVGMSTKSDMKKRLSTYQTGSPFRDYEVHSQFEVEDARTVETLVHKRLLQMIGVNGSTANKNEWYKINPNLASNIIDSILQELQDEEE